MAGKTLNEEVGKAFKLKKGAPTQFAHWKLGDIDVSTMTMAQATELAKDKDSPIEAIQKKADLEKSEPAKQ